MVADCRVAEPIQLSTIFPATRLGLIDMATTVKAALKLVRLPAKLYTSTA